MAPPNGDNVIPEDDIPRSYLEAYPFPAFVLPIHPDDAASSSTALRPVWHNAHWQRVAGGRSLSDLVSNDAAGRIRRWLSCHFRGEAESGQPRRRRQSGNGDRRRDSFPSSDDLITEADATLSVEFGFDSGTASLQLLVTCIPSRNRSEAPRPLAVITTIPQSTLGLFQPLQARDQKPFESTQDTPSGQDAQPIPQTAKPTSPLSAPVTPPAADGTLPDAKRPAINTLFNGVKVVQNWNTGNGIRVLIDGTEIEEYSDIRADSVPHVRSNLFQTDWSTTPLGPMKEWPDDLRMLMGLSMGFAIPVCLWWGPQLTMIYNNSYAKLCEGHPGLFGVSGEAAWAELRRTLGPHLETLLAGKSIYRDDQLYLHKDKRTGKVTEAYRSYVFSTAVDDRRHFSCIWTAMRDSTGKVVSDRRIALFKELADRALKARKLRDFENGVLATLEKNPKEAPFALLYHVERAYVPSSTGRSNSTIRIRYAGGVGVPDRHPSAPKVVNVDMSKDTVSHGLPTPDASPVIAVGSFADQKTSPPLASSVPTAPWPIAETLRTNAPVLVADCSEIIKGYPVRVWDELPSAAVVIPLGSYRRCELPGAVLVLGLNPMLPYDEVYESFVRDLGQQVALYLSMVHLYTADQQRIDHLAGIDRDKSRLLLSIAHQLASPLSLVLGPLDDLIDELDSERQCGTLDRLISVRFNVRRLKRLVEMLNDVSHMEMDRLKGAFRKENLGQVTEGICAFFTEAAANIDCRYRYECDETPHDTYVSRELWEKILFVVIGGGMQICKKKIIELKLKYTATHAVLYASDNGDLFLPNNAPNVAERYPHRLVNITDIPKNVGVAVMFVAKMVQLHRGTYMILTLRPDEEPVYHGTLFEIKIPFGTAHLAPDLVDETPDDSTAPTAASLEFSHEILDEMHQTWSKKPPAGPGMNTSGSNDSLIDGLSPVSSRSNELSTLYFRKTDIILIVDDVPANRRYLRSMLEPFCTIMEAEEGQDALNSFVYSQPDLIITDAMVPRAATRGWDTHKNLNGLELLRELRQGTKEQQMVPVIMLTGVDENVNLSGLRADDTLVRPFKARELIARAHMQMQLGKRRRMLERLFEERTMELRVLTESSPVAIFRCNSAGYMTYGNAAWYETSGCPPSDTKDDPDSIIEWMPYLTEQYQRRFRNWMTWITEAESGVEVELQWRNGRWCSAKLIRLDKMATGVKPGFLGCMVDITERKLNEELQRQRVAEAEQRRADAEEAKKQQELLIDITSHEIRNPISSLMQCASLVKTNLLSLKEQLSDAIGQKTEFKPTSQLLLTLDEDLEALDSIYQCGLVQERISNDVLSLSKIQLDLLEIFDVEVDVRKEARKTVAIFQNEARMNRIQLRLVVGDTFAKTGLDTIMTDPVRLGQVVTNLLSNATKFTASSDERRIELRIDAGFERPPDGSCVKPDSSTPAEITEGMPVFIFIAVSDTGPGLTAAELEHLFERFTQASPMTHTVFGGSGLGLYVCRKIVMRMGGGIDVASEYGKGSEFRFFVEGKIGSVSRTPDKPPLSVHTPSRCRTEPIPASTPTPTSPSRDMPLKEFVTEGSWPRILVVEDNFINRTVLLRQLKHVGWAADSAPNGLEGVDKIRTSMAVGEAETEGYDCVLMDLEMPVMDGYTAVRSIREHEHSGELKRSTIIALTGNARQAKLEENMVNFDDVVVKPYRLDDLLRKIERVIGVRERSASPASDSGSSEDIVKNTRPSPVRSQSYA